MEYHIWQGIEQIIASYAAPAITYDHLTEMLLAVYLNYRLDPDYLDCSQEDYGAVQDLILEQIRRLARYREGQLSPYVGAIANPHTGHLIAIRIRTCLPPGELRLSVADLFRDQSWGHTPIPADVGKIIWLERERK